MSNKAENWGDKDKNHEKSNTYHLMTYGWF
jgi:hypothetical protein